MKRQYIGIIIVMAMVGLAIAARSSTTKVLWLESPVTVRYIPLTNSLGQIDWGMADENWVHDNCTKSNIQIGLRDDGIVIWRKKPLETSLNDVSL